MITDDRVYVVAELGINHNGSLDNVVKMIKIAHAMGCDAVKFQKRTVETVYTLEELVTPRVSVYGTTNGDLKHGLEFDREHYDVINVLCHDLGIEWYASPWDIDSLEFLFNYGLPYIKIPSALITDKEMLMACATSGVPLLLSTGMATLDMIHKSVDFVYKQGGIIDCLYHCTSTYPTEPKEINLSGIVTLRNEFDGIPVGFSGHERGVPTSIMAIALGARSIERHFTLDRTMWGSDQSASLEPEGIRRICSAARIWEKAEGDGKIRFYPSEKPIAAKLRKKETL